LRDYAPFSDECVGPDLAIITFAHPAHAERLVAGLPAVARTVREARLAGIRRCRIMVGPHWHPPAPVLVEIVRMAQDMDVTFDGPVDEAAIVLAGHRQPAASAIAAARRAEARNHPDVRIMPAGTVSAAIVRVTFDGSHAAAQLDEAGRAILLATGKSADGIVSRNFNRPISRAISGQLLRLSWIRPAHATVGTALLAVLMFAALLSGGSGGLVLGAVLFQAASVFDGVDGEIARATFRTSPGGARADSLVDAATNLAFVLGVAVNLDARGHDATAALGYAALAIFALGLFLIGRVAARGTQPFSFDIVKEKFRRGAASPGQIQLVQAVTFLTSRDFIALFFALMIAIGYAEHALALFALAATCWLAAVIWALTRRVA
jgi:CDP-L-myo-inositol myo-inositolphosphotransferase